MEELNLHVPTDEELVNLNPEDIAIDSELITHDVEAQSADELLQTTFNNDSIDDLNDGEVEIENAE